MKILLVNAYLRNTGDAALSSVVISQLKQAWPGASITISSVEAPEAWPEFEACPNIGSIRLYAGLVDGNKLRRISRKLLVLGVELSWPYLPVAWRRAITAHLPGMLRAELAALDQADLVVSTAGGYLNGEDSLAGDLSVRYMLLPLKLASAGGKPVVLAPQSYGPFGNRRQEQAVKHTLNRCQVICTRETKSLKILRQLGVKNQLLNSGVDAAFAFDIRQNPRSKPLQKTALKVGITARTWLSPKQQAAYEKALAEFIVDIYSKYRAKVYLISHVMADVYESSDGVAVERRIAELANQMGGELIQIETNPDQHVMKKHYENLDFMVGTRFHSVIFSLTAGVPAIAIEYQHKASGIMLDLGLEKWVMPLDQVTSKKLLALFDQLVTRQADYRRQLKQTMPAYMKTASQSGEVFKRAFDEWQAATGVPTVKKSVRL